MPPRRSHTKSRLGCSQCRRRRVKCDEKLPRCSSCTQRDEICVYSRFPTKSTPLPTTTPATPPMNATAPLNAGIGHSLPAANTTHQRGADETTWSAARIRELELLHHWCSKTSTNFTPELVDMFQNYLVKEALKNSHLMEALLALAAFHIACETDDPILSHDFTGVGMSYQTRAIAALRVDLGSLSPEKCDPVFATSVLIMVCVMVSPFLPVGHEKIFNFNAEAILPLADIIRGLGLVIETSQRKVLQGPLSGMFNVTWPSLPHATVSPIIEDLRRLNAGKTDSSAAPVFEHAIEALERKILDKDAVFPWIAMAGLEFIERLKLQDSVAMAIFMVWGALMTMADNQWWATFSGKNLVKETSSILISKGDECTRIIVWCRREVGLSERP
ncbi:hypothetical protein C7974DRAFT_385415 [Boeremia exigua]|uniref:uncharacterized protein n=1 Tax=Boeremia exigua TaxID=749465 RepID=UPI001E8CEDC7|nr:uncharacterized protein C7974DRAFT_385415 [Boeremia exigua]KAH6642425.1 hypothetical protein C7974DRAFT_385415 [Boeremia exigua]